MINNYVWCDVDVSYKKNMFDCAFHGGDAIKNTIYYQYKKKYWQKISKCTM